MASQRKAAGASPAAGRSPGGTLEQWSAFFEQDLPRVADPSKLSKALAMLRAERFQLFAEVRPGRVVGVVRSQSSSKRVYACRMSEDGRYACCTQNLITCVVSRDSPCKHLLVLVLGLVNAGQLAPEAAVDWLERSRGQDARPDKDEMAAIFLRYKGAEAGEVDWRPTETIPEDFYAM
ncbi:MAG TPA: hypothetical protein VG406_17595 [Isosphaeraceae bacterium]|jgi:hypothetical protein|nr:hypothetical protein [Isosphaeraceae bacterium]